MAINPERCPIRATLWRIVVDPVDVPTESPGGLKFTEETVTQLKYVRQAGRVVDIGPLAFSGSRFRDDNGVNHRACEVGDLVVYGMSSGAKVRVIDPDDSERVLELRVLNDDEIGAKLESEDCLLSDIMVGGAL